MSINYVRLVDNTGNIVDLPLDFYLTDNGWRYSSNVKNIAFAAGGRDIADNFPTSRTIQIEGYIRASSAAELETVEREVQKAVSKGGKLYVIGDVKNRYLEVSAPTVNSNYINDYLFEKMYNVSFVVELPFWQDGTETEEDFQIVSSTGGVSFSVDNSDSDFLVNPIITIATDQGADLPYIRLLNQTDGAMFFEYEDANFVSGDTLVIDSEDGTVLKNGNDSLEYYTTPRFLRVQPVVNNFLYEGDDCTITISFRKVYF